jgi:hypothetical protein
VPLRHLATVSLLSAVVRPAAAAEPLLAIETAGGVVLHAVAGIVAIELAGDTLRVVEEEGPPYEVPVADVVRMWFDASGASVDAPPIGAAILDATHLLPARPSPASVSATIPFELALGGRVHLAIFDVRGSLVRTLVDAPREAGRHTAVWDGRNDAGGRVASGMYFFRLRAAGVEESRRVIYLR